MLLSEGKPWAEFHNIFHLNFVCRRIPARKAYFCSYFQRIMRLQIHRIEFGTPEYDDAVRLRYEVLRRPLGLEFTPEQLSEEYDQIHLAAYASDGALVAYLNLTPADATTVKMRQVAVAPERQGKGIGAVLVNESEKLAKSLGYDIMSLHARETAVPFYKRLGYSILGERFEEVTVPHFRMEKILK